MQTHRWRNRAAVFAVGLLAATVIAATLFAGGQTDGRWTARADVEPPPAAIVSQIDRHFAAEWEALGLTPAVPADDLLVVRRLSLALHGTVPSLEEIRAFEADTRPDRLRLRIRTMLADRRFADYFAERLARVWVGTAGGPFIVYRRDRFTRWLSDQLFENRPYDALVRDVLATDGLWTSEPAVNFISVTQANEELDRNLLAARTVRAFLGQRIDCAQCHNHPFADWKQGEFQGLAAFYGQTEITFQGVSDQPRLFDRTLEFQVEDPATQESRTIAPAVPFLPECLPDAGSRRAQLAAWITHPQNARFTRATVNRVWGLVFGRPYREPVDDLPDPEPGHHGVLDRLGNDFRDHNYDLRRLIETMALSRPFRIESHTAAAETSATETSAAKRADAAWAMFPLSRLRPEQMIGSMIQAARLTTIDQNTHLGARALKFFRENDFIQEYGDSGENELEPRSATTSQALLRMNGKLMRELTEVNPATAAGRIALLAPNDVQRWSNSAFW